MKQINLSLMRSVRKTEFYFSRNLDIYRFNKIIMIHVQMWLRLEEYHKKVLRHSRLEYSNHRQLLVKHRFDNAKNYWEMLKNYVHQIHQRN